MHADAAGCIPVLPILDLKRGTIPGGQLALSLMSLMKGAGTGLKTDEVRFQVGNERHYLIVLQRIAQVG